MKIPGQANVYIINIPKGAYNIVSIRDRRNKE